MEASQSKACDGEAGVDCKHLNAICRQKTSMDSSYLHMSGRPKKRVDRMSQKAIQVSMTELVIQEGWRALLEGELEV